MKIRSGFVSNSSSSSFIIVGIECDETEELVEKINNDCLNSDYVVLSNYTNNEKFGIGKYTYVSEYDYGCIDISTILENEKELQKEFNLTDKAKVYAGEHYS
ncbi:MAG: hypothetical protein M0R17_02875 [Candidatus Omnitrophica bacterium]|jgi:hypothetical protein|nr:hypothetical protein [Candidatus Omnitrophota bacterium]